MILADIKHYLANYKRASLVELAQRFDAQPAAMRAMLQHWIRKGKVCQEQTPMPACASKCQQCNPMQMEVYCWHEE